MSLPYPQIASFLSHEIRNALSSLASGINVMERAGDRPVSIPILPIMRARLKEAGFRMDDLSDLHRLMLGTSASEECSVSPERLVRNAADMFLGMCSPEQPQEFEFNLSAEGGQEFLLDEKRAAMGLVNLLLFTASKLRAKAPLTFAAFSSGSIAGKNFQIQLSGRYMNANPPETDPEGRVRMDAQPALAWSSALLDRAGGRLSLTLDRGRSTFEAVVDFPSIAAS